MDVSNESRETKRPTLELFEINRGQNYFLRLSVLVVEIIPTVLRLVAQQNIIILLPLQEADYYSPFD